MAEVQACQHCAGTIQDPDQRNCPHCLEDLRTRSFQTREDLERYREDRRAHGAPVHGADEDGSGGLVAVLLGVAATVMIVAGATVVFGALASGDGARTARALSQAVVPLAMGAGLFELARRKRGGGG